jgi:hypothetical protein
VAKLIKTTGVVMVDVPVETKDAVMSSFSIGAASGTLGSVIHGTRIELIFLNNDSPAVKISMGASDALQIAEEIRAAVHRREDVKRA